MTEKLANSLDVIDLDAYFQRIGYQGERLPTLQVLQAIHYQHARTIAFENLNSFLKQSVCLDLASLQQKLIHEGRGGYCFEQNLLLRSVLVALGFQVTSLAARVLWNLPAGTVTPRSHMLLRVDISEEIYIADVGFGGPTLTAPLSLTPDIEQATPHEAFRLLALERTYIMQVYINQQWKPIYCFDLQEQQLPDYEASNWYISTHPNSLFTTTLLAAKPGLDCRYALRNNQFRVNYLDGSTQRRILATGTELRAVLENDFCLNLGASANLDSALQNVVEQFIANDNP